ncbi:MAG: hypothetical protein AB7P35_17695 [Hyphomonadaceae bacterium]
MASQNEIANHALDLLGETSIDDINDTTERAERLLAAWEATRDRALRAHWWNFAIKREALAADATAPAWGFTKAYTIDGDVVRVIQVDQYFPGPVLSDFVGADTSPYRIENGKIITDIAAPLKVRWIVNSIDVGMWDPLFAVVMACNLADRLSTRVTGSENIKLRIKEERRMAIVEAVRTNAIEQPPAHIGDNSWMAARQAV